MKNINDEIPQEIEITPGHKSERSKKEKYKFIKKYNNNTYLYKNIEHGYYETFGVQDLGMINKAPLTIYKTNNDFVRKR